MERISIAQQKCFWVAFSAACSNLSLTEKSDKEAYRKRVLKEAGGVLHLSDLDRTSGYDKVMSKFWMDAGKYENAMRYISSISYRLISVLELKAKTLVGSSYQSYIQGVMARSGIGVSRGSLKDLTEAELRALIAILDTHLRRQKSKGEGK